VQLASTLEGVVYQRLLPRVDGGLVAAYEILLANHAVRNMVREGKTRQLRNVISTHQSEGMQTLEMALSDLVAEGIIDYETALKVSLYPKEVEKPMPMAQADALGAQLPDESSAGSGDRNGRRGAVRVSSI
jgi:twitching motility protein PilT